MRACEMEVGYCEKIFITSCWICLRGVQLVVEAGHQEAPKRRRVNIHHSIVVVATECNGF